MTNRPETFIRSGSMEKDIQVQFVTPGAFQKRKYFDEAAQQDLASSIEEYGLLNAIIVRIAGSGFELISGERRWRAVKDLLKRPLIRARILPANCPDSVAHDIAAIDNFQRRDLLPSERIAEIVGFAQRGHTQQETARLLGRPVSYIADWSRLARLSPQALASLDAKEINKGHGELIAAIEGEVHQQKAVDLVRMGSLTKSQLRGRIQHFPKKAYQQTHTEQRATIASKLNPGGIRAEDLARQLVNIRHDILTSSSTVPTSITSDQFSALYQKIDAVRSALGDLERSLRSALPLP